MEDSGTESGAVGRRDIRRRRGRVAARTEARRHGNQACIPQEATEAEAMAADIATEVGLVMGTAPTEILETETRAAPVVRHTPETAGLMAARGKEGRIEKHTGIRAPGAVVSARLRVAVTRG